MQIDQLQPIFDRVSEFKWLLVIGASSIFGAMLWHHFSKKFNQIRSNRIRKHGLEGEKIAEAWLVKQGFQIVDTQESIQGEFECDAEVISYKVRPDIIAQNEDGLWVVEVKTGKAANPNHGDTRRQILEYSHLYPDHLVALFDADQQSFMPINFYQEKKVSVNKPPFPTYAYFLGFVLGILFSGLCIYLLVINS